MIHATFEDGTTMLFDPNEDVWVCEDVISGEYISGEREGFAKNFIKPGVHVLSSKGRIPSATNIVSVREV